MEIRKKLYVFTLFAVLCGCFFHAEGTSAQEARSGSAGKQEAYVSAGDVICSNEDVPGEIKKPIEKGKSLFTYIIRVIGWLMVVFGIIFFAISFPTHQTDQRIMGGVSFFIGLLVAFAPEIAAWVTGA